MNLLITIAIACFGIALLCCTRDRENIDGLIYGLTCFVLQCALFTGLFLKEIDNISSQMIQIMLILSATMVLTAGVILIKRAR